MIVTMTSFIQCGMMNKGFFFICQQIWRESMKKERIYRQVTVVAVLSLVPVVLAAGVVTGCLAGGFLEQKFRAPAYVFLGCVLFGIGGGIYEVFRLIRLAIKLDKEESNGGSGCQ